MRNQNVFSKRLMELCLLILMLLLPSKSHGNETTDKYYFNNYRSSDGGLSFDCVNAIIRDSRGFMWFGTSNGLNRFDGERFTCFYKEDLGINSSFVTFLMESSAGDIWIGTDHGLCRYDLKLDRFIAFKKESDIGSVISNKVRYIRENPDGKVFFAVNEQGLFSYDPKDDSFLNYYADSNGTTLPANITSFLFDKNGVCWIALYYTGLWIADDQYLGLSRADAVDITTYFDGDNIVDMTLSSENTFVVASVNHGLSTVLPRLEQVKTLIPNKKDQFLPEAVKIDSKGRCFLASDKGIYVYDPFNSDISHIYSSTIDRLSLSDSRILSLCIDDANGLWAGSKSSGVDYAPFYARNFRKITAVDNISLDNALVRSFAEEANGDMWITTEHCGLFKYTISTGQLRKINYPLLPDELFGICLDSNRVWIGSSAGICRIDTESGRVKIYEKTADGAVLRGNNFYSLHRTMSNRIFAGYGLGILVYNEDTDSFSKLSSHFDGVFVLDMEESNDGFLWAASYAHGLFLYDLLDDRIIANYRHNPADSTSIPSDKLLSVYKDRNARVWVSTFGFGIGCFDGTHFKNYSRESTKGKFPSDVVYGVIEDTEGNLWASTSDGLISMSRDSERIRVYRVEDGIIENGFSQNSSISSRDGHLFFGSQNGLIRFNPKDLTADERTIQLVITDFFIEDKKILAGVGDSPLKSNIDWTTKMYLKHNQNCFSFHFALTSSFSPAGGSVFCCLEGYDTDWRQAELGRITYMNVPHGHYTLKIKGMTRDEQWGPSHQPIEIIIVPPFYRSRIAYLLYLLLIITALILGFWILYKKLSEYQKRRQLEIEERERAMSPQYMLLKAAESNKHIWETVNIDFNTFELEFLQKVEDIIVKNLSDTEFGVEALANAMHIGRQTLNLKMKLILNMTATDYIKLARLFAAVKLLPNDDSRVNDVCYSVGFNTPSYFAKTFRLMFGILPVEYKKIRQNQID